MLGVTLGDGTAAAGVVPGPSHTPEDSGWRPSHGPVAERLRTGHLGLAQGCPEG